jgi:two-component system, chemotaxis family, CheB/CheR fusion protein
MGFPSLKKSLKIPIWSIGTVGKISADSTPEKSMKKKGKMEKGTPEGETPSTDMKAGPDDYPVIVVGVGIGSSSRNLPSLKRLFGKMPPGHGLAFVLIQDLNPAKENKTLRFLQEWTPLTVIEAMDGMPVLADHIYVIPPDRYLNITLGRLTLKVPFSCDGLRMPIDHFFCSLAMDLHRRGCGILLSGRESDGTLGLSEIKSANGKTFVQDPARAEFPEMSQQAIEAGVVDFILPAEDMAQAVITLAGQIREETRHTPVYSPELDAELRAILEILLARERHDFRCYKPSTLIRRIRRRMTLAKVKSLAAYSEFLLDHPEEVGLLHKDLFINVTEFFRQPQAWEVIEKAVISPLVEGVRPGKDIRLWVPGCSTGQEGYTLAILLAEHLEKSGKKGEFQIFATDSDAASIHIARKGSYSKEEIGESISPQRLKRFFTFKDGLYQIAKEVREQIVFAPQNITTDPPFSKMDLISCRNLLIYLDPEVQKKIIRLFHFALREGGYLFLGTAETVGDRQDLFEPLSKKWRIYRRIGVGRSIGIEIPVYSASEAESESGRSPLPAVTRRISTPRPSLTAVAQRILLDRFAPACVIIDRRQQVLFTHGAVEDYLTFPKGELTTRVVEMAREGLQARLQGAVDKCFETDRSVTIVARVKRGRKSIPVRATISPLRYSKEMEGLLLIAFENYHMSEARSPKKATEESLAHHLEDELKVTREELQSTIEQLERSNERFKASNEEVMAANEELQSANEELETSKEELQSLNEELNTINIRLQENVEELKNTNNDVMNLLSSTTIATVFLDKELRVRRYTPVSTRLFSLIPSDVGRPIGDILRRFSDQGLISDAYRVLTDLTPLSKEVQTEDGRWYIRRVTPYRTQDDRIEGVVMTFTDICELKDTEEALRRNQADLEAARSEAEIGKHRLAIIVDSIADGFFALNRQWRFTHINDAALRHFRKKREELIGSIIFEVFPDIQGTLFESEYRRAMATGEPVHFEASSIVSDRMMDVHAYPGPDNMTILFQDVTEEHRLEAALRQSEERLRLAQNAAQVGVWAWDPDNQVIELTPEFEILYGLKPGTIRTFQDWTNLIHPEDLPRITAEQSEAISQHRSFNQEFRILHASGETRWVQTRGGALYDKEGRSIRVFGINMDITSRKRLEATLQETHERVVWLARFPEENPNPVVRVSAEGKVLYCNPASMKLPGWSCEVGQCLSEPLRQIAEQAMVSRQEILQDIELAGRIYWIAATPFPVENYSNLYGRDITKRKQAEEALQESQGRMARAQEIAHLGSWELDLVKNRLTWSDEIYRIFGLKTQEFGATYEAFLERVHPDDRTAVDRAYTGSLQEGKDSYEIEHRVVRKSTGELRWVREKCNHIRDVDGRLIRSIGMVLDITERKRAEEALQRNEAESKLLSETAGQLLATDNPQGIIESLCRKVMEHLTCQVFLNFLMDEKAGKLHLNAGAGIPKEEMGKIEWLDYGTTVCGQVARRGVRIVAENIGATPDPRTDLVKSYGVRAYACHPLKIEGRVIGTLSFGTKTRSHFTLEELALMRTITDQVATAMERIRLIRQLERSREELEIRVRERTVDLAKAIETLRHLSSRVMAAQEEERKRVALEIHDTIGASLSAVKYKVETVIGQMDKNTGPERAALETVIPIILECIEESRRIQTELRPPMLDDLGLLAALSWFSRRFQTIYSKIEIEKEIDIEEEDIPLPLRVVVFRIIQEAMNNMAKHSRADHLRLSLQKRDSRMELLVQDNGRGFSQEKVLSLESTQRGLGLSSMKERAELSGGTLTIESAEGQGTTVRAFWPLPAEV